MDTVATEKLKNLVEKLLELQPAVQRYEEAENLLTGLMICAEVGEIAIPGRGRAWLNYNSAKPGYGLVVEPDETPVAAIIKILPFKGLPPN